MNRLLQLLKMLFQPERSARGQLFVFGMTFLAAIAICAAPAMAALLLGELGPDAKDAVPSLLKCLKKDFSLNGVSVAAARALGKIGADPDRVVPALIEVLKKEELRTLGAQALAGFGPRAKAAAPVLRGLLADKDLDVCLAAYLALDSIGEKAENTVPVVLGVFQNSDRGARLAAYEALKEADDVDARRVVPLLVGAFEQFRADRPEIASTLGQFGPSAVAAVPVLKKAAAQKADLKSQQAAVDALQKIRKTEK
jgi:HEAT repeat protein